MSMGMSMRIYLLSGGNGNKTKVWYPLGLGMGIWMHFFYGDRHGIVKLVATLLSSLLKLDHLGLRLVLTYLDHRHVLVVDPTCLYCQPRSHYVDRRLGLTYLGRWPETTRLACQSWSHRMSARAKTLVEIGWAWPCRQPRQVRRWPRRTSWDE